MPKYEIKREYGGRSVSECYQAGLRTMQSAGYTIVTKCDIASLAICQTLIQGSRVDLNLMVPLGKPTTVILNFSSERADEMSLKLEADRVLGILVNELGRG
jgi:hypothetical protein